MNKELKKKLIKFIASHHNEKDEVPNIEDADSDIINFIISKTSDDSRAADFTIPLISALIQTNHTDLANKLIQIEGLGVNAGDSNGDTPLHYAILKQNAYLVRELAKHGANSNKIPYPEDEDYEMMRVWTVPANSEFTIHDIVLGNENQFSALEKVNFEVAHFLGAMLEFEYT